MAKCEKFKCIYLDEGECEAQGGECIADLCECFSECISCQDMDLPECREV